MRKILFILIVFVGCIFFSGCNQKDLEINDKDLELNGISKVDLHISGSTEVYSVNEQFHDDIESFINSINGLRKLKPLDQCLGWSYSLTLYNQNNNIFSLSNNCGELLIRNDDNEFVADNKYLKEFYDMIDNVIKKQFLVDFDTSAVNDFSIGIINNQKFIEIPVNSLDDVINDIDYILDNYIQYKFTPTEIISDLLDYKYVISNDNEELIIYLYASNNTNNDIALIYKDKKTDETITVWIKNQFNTEVNKLIKYVEDNNQ